MHVYDIHNSYIYAHIHTCVLYKLLHITSVYYFYMDIIYICIYVKISLFLSFHKTKIFNIIIY